LDASPHRTSPLTLTMPKNKNFYTIPGSKKQFKFRGWDYFFTAPPAAGEIRFPGRMAAVFLAGGGKPSFTL
jgi:hypothetical protein